MRFFPDRCRCSQVPLHYLTALPVNTTHWADSLLSHLLISRMHFSAAAALEKKEKIKGIDKTGSNSNPVSWDYLSKGWRTSWEDWSSLLWIKIESLPSTASLSSPGSLSPFMEFLGLAFAKVVSGSEAVGERTVWQPWSRKEKRKPRTKPWIF